MVKWIPIQVRDKEIQLAKERARIQRENALKLGGTSNFQTEDPEENHFVGHLGEICFDRVLTEKKIPHIYFNKLDGTGDDGRDFDIYGIIYDVKTALLTWPMKDLQPGYKFYTSEEQLKKECGPEYLIHLQSESHYKTLYIIGYISKEDAKTYPVEKTSKMYHSAHAIPFSDLHDLSNLFNIDFKIKKSNFYVSGLNNFY